jgi:hypothetical protein
MDQMENLQLTIVLLDNTLAEVRHELIDDIDRW